MDGFPRQLALLVVRQNPSYWDGAGTATIKAYTIENVHGIGAEVDGGPGFGFGGIALVDGHGVLLAEDTGGETAGKAAADYGDVQAMWCHHWMGYGSEGWFGREGEDS